jgi:hypothetical protein
MKFKIKHIVVLIALIFCASGFAQPAEKDKVEALRVSFITKEISLTPSEGQSFWPLYNEYNDKIRALRKTFKMNYGKKTNFSSDSEAEDFLNAEIKLKQNEVDLQKEYTEKFKKVLGAKKTALLRKAEDAFKRKLIETIKGSTDS